MKVASTHCHAHTATYCHTAPRTCRIHPLPHHTSLTQLGAASLSVCTPTGGFGFFFPVFYVGGLGFLAYMVMALVASGPSIVYAYAISSKTVIEVTGDARKRVQKEVKMHSIDSIDYVTVTGNSVVFGGGSGSITIQHQRDTSQLFQYLQQRRAASNGLPAGAGAGGLGSTPPASLDPSGNPIKMASFV